MVLGATKQFSFLIYCFIKLAFDGEFTVGNLVPRFEVNILKIFILDSNYLKSTSCKRVDNYYENEFHLQDLFLKLTFIIMK